VGGGFPLQRIDEIEHRLESNLMPYEKDKRKRKSLPSIRFMTVEPETPDDIVIDLDKTVVCASVSTRARVNVSLRNSGVHWAGVGRRALQGRPRCCFTRE
jgi:hypothetical protein